MNVERASRPAAGADITGAMGVMARAFPPEYGEAWTEEQLRSTLCMPGVDLFIARVEGNVAGFALIRQVLDEAELLLIAVDPDRRGKSLGRRILSNVESYLCETGIIRMFLEMRAGNPAERLYRRFGFNEIGLRPQYYRGADGSRYDALTLEKNPLTSSASGQAE